MPPTAASIDPEEIARFSALAENWWNPAGPFKPLHKFNPVRLAFIRDSLCRHFGRDPAAPAPLADISILDIGCGGGLVCEPLARLGARVTGIDAADRNIGIAAAHAAESGLTIDYRCISAEELQAGGARFDAVLTLEVVEHVADPAGFIRTAAGLLEPNGLFIAATLNRTPQAFALAILGAEYVMRWLPRGTHDWKKFLKPHELARLIRAAGLTLAGMKGAAYSLLDDRWSLSDDTGVNYMMTATKAA